LSPPFTSLIMHILIAPNAFKHSLDAAAAAKAIQRGLLLRDPACTTQCVPVGDGGDGTGVLLTEAANGILIHHTVHDPLGRKISAAYGWVDDKTAIIEMAAASGIRLLKNEERDPTTANSFGTGELILHALNKGAARILLCVGGSATVDGGCGILSALGVKFFDEKKQEIKNIPGGLNTLSGIDVSELHPLIRQCELIILSDVSNPLLGNNGAAKIFGPQKGASPEQVALLEDGLSRLNKLLRQKTGKDFSGMKHGGAAGGVVAGLCALAGATVVNGIDYFLDYVGFDDALTNASLVITGEGSIDLQTLDGKAPFGVALRAKEKNIPVIAFTGRSPDTGIDALHEYFQQIIPVSDSAISLIDALASTERNLEIKAGEIIY
jgi:glycerate kinase